MLLEVEENWGSALDDLQLRSSSSTIQNVHCISPVSTLSQLPLLPSNRQSDTQKTLNDEPPNKKPRKVI